MDARGHLAQSREAFRAIAIEKGIKEAVRQRDEPFGDGIVRP
jgi:enoyl-CoA hydratase